jgi:hypothetical protein
MVPAVNSAHSVSRLTALIGLTPRRMYYMAFLPGRQLPDDEPVILSYVDYVATLKKERAKSVERPKPTNI